MCNICDMLEKPDHETKLKMLGFSKDMNAYKKRAEKFFRESDDLTFDKIEEMQNEELDKIFKRNFQDTDDDKLLFEQLVTRTLWAFATGRQVDTNHLEKRIQDERQNLN